MFCPEINTARDGRRVRERRCAGRRHVTRGGAVGLPSGGSPWRGAADGGGPGERDHQRSDSAGGADARRAPVEPRGLLDDDRLRLGGRRRASRNDVGRDGPCGPGDAARPLRGAPAPLAALSCRCESDPFVSEIARVTATATSAAPATRAASATTSAHVVARSQADDREQTCGQADGARMDGFSCWRLEHV
jgi:hypothetical protein